MFRKIFLACVLLSSPFAVAGKPFMAKQNAAAPVPEAEQPALVPTTAVATVPQVVSKPLKGGGLLGPEGAISKKAAVSAAMILAFNSGYSNGCCLGGGVMAGAKNNAVAAVTGAWTTSALGAASGNMAAFSAQFKGIMSYMFGSVIAGALIPKPKAFVLAENTGLVFLIGSALMYAASSVAEKSPTAMTAFYFALMANGLQNSVTSVHTGNLCRTSHFTGITSDMGTFVGQCLMGNKENLFKLKVFALLGLSFWLGGFSSFFVTQQMASESLLFSSGVHFAIGLYVLLNK